MDTALYICSNNTKYANSCGKVNFDNDKMKSVDFIKFLLRPSGGPKINIRSLF